ncbi:pirin family protein [Telluribacter sp. SYSU D00476]|uniref:pirin family protein n=1 Tax=Telluribacter sp. SYSU D00476 TaxID=2811430 RepID=UPI001FF671C3|nr:pirin family protein [Telluribacter sp. SYSU D00476]
MKKSIAASYSGKNSRVGELLVNRLLPNRYVQAVGPFVFLDHLYPSEQKPQIPQAPSGEFAHPHRGITTFTYLFSGSMEHYDSSGHHGIVEGGGAQWMKAGNGVIHDENPSPEFQKQGGVLHALQFWINLPAKNKAEAPDYLALQPHDIPEILLPDEAGVLRVVIGTYGDVTSPVTAYSRQFIYHVRLQAKSTFALDTIAGLEYAVFIPNDEVVVSGSKHGKSELVVFGEEEGTITLSNTTISPTDVIVFGGEPYTEPIVAQGPFVMNNLQEIAQAYQDFFNGKYGQIEYKELSSTSGVAAR